MNFDDCRSHLNFEEPTPKDSSHFWKVKILWIFSPPKRPSDGPGPSVQCMKSCPEFQYRNVGLTAWNEAECSFTHVSTGFWLHKIGRHCLSNNQWICFYLGLKSQFGDGFQKRIARRTTCVEYSMNQPSFISSFLALYSYTVLEFPNFLKKHIFKNKLRWSAGSRGQGSNPQTSFNDTTLLRRRPKLRVLLGSRAILPQHFSIPEIWWNETHPVFVVDVWISNGLTRIWWYDSGSPGAFRRTQQQKTRLIL